MQHIGLSNTESRTRQAWIERFTVPGGKQELIALENAVFASIGPAGALAAARFKVLGAGVDADDRILYHRASGTLFYDPDGSGAQARQVFAVIDTAPALTAADFLVV